MTRISDVRSRLARVGPPRTRDHEGDFARVTLPDRECDLLRVGASARCRAFRLPDPSFEPPFKDFRQFGG